MAILDIVRRRVWIMTHFILSVFHVSSMDYLMMSFELFFLLLLGDLQTDESLIVQLIVNFSIYSNLKKIFKTNEDRGDQLKCLDGIRVLSMGSFY